jgi:hypothetical protein
MKLGKIDNTSLAGKNSGLFKSCLLGASPLMVMLSGLLDEAANAAEKTLTA